MTAVGDKINLLIKKFKIKKNDERLVSGIAPNKEGEVDIGICNIIQRSDEPDKARKAESTAKKQKLDVQAAEVEELWKTSFGSFSETRKRKSLDDDDNATDKSSSATKFSNSHASVTS